jgi:hypothetical protein
LRDSACGGGRRRSAGELTGDGVLELRATFCDMDRLYAERGTRRTRPRALEGGSGGHGGSHREGAARLTAARGGKGYGP